MKKEAAVGFSVDFLLLSLFYFLLPLGSYGGWLLVLGTIIIRYRWMGIKFQTKFGGLTTAINWSLFILITLLVAHILLDIRQVANYPILLNEEIPTCAVCLILIFSIKQIDIDDFINFVQQRQQRFFLIGAISAIFSSAMFFNPDIKHHIYELFSWWTEPTSNTLRTDYNMFATGIILSSLVPLFIYLGQKKYFYSYLLFVSTITIVITTGSRRAAVAVCVSYMALLIISPIFLQRPQQQSFLAIKSKLVLLVATIVSVMIINAFLIKIPEQAGWSSGRFSNTVTSKERIWAALSRDGLVQWGFTRLRLNDTSQWLFGNGLDYMNDLENCADLPKAWSDSNMQPYYIHSPPLGTLLMLGAIGFFAMIVFALLSTYSLISTNRRALLALMIPMLCVLTARALMSGNTIFSSPILCGVLLICSRFCGKKKK